MFPLLFPVQKDHSVAAAEVKQSALELREAISGCTEAQRERLRKKLGLCYKTQPHTLPESGSCEEKHE